MHHCLLWLGGTYAKNLDLFDKCQATAQWIYTHIRPLGIQPPEGACHGFRKSLLENDVNAFIKQWKANRWVGPMPDPVAVFSPAMQLLHYVKHSACCDRDTCRQRSSNSAEKSLCIACEESKKVKWVARGDVLFPQATAPRPPYWFNYRLHGFRE